jgi:cytochrome c biogenesis protein CcmG, thiol:disulfide interchange protein DsbE
MSELIADAQPARGRIAPIAALAAAVVVAALVAVLVLALGDGGEQYADSPIVGRTAPPISGATFDGESIDVNDYRGRWLVVNFFATWCVPCVEEHDDLVAFSNTHAVAGDASVVSVVFSDDDDDVKAFFDERGGDWPQIYSEYDDFPVAFGVAAVPETWIIDPSGVVQLRLISKVTAEQLDTILQQYREQYR